MFVKTNAFQEVEQLKFQSYFQTHLKARFVQTNNKNPCKKKDMTKRIWNSTQMIQYVDLVGQIRIPDCCHKRFIQFYPSTR